MKPDDEAVRKAQSFLAKTQREDGGWPMVSRAIMRDGKPPKNLEPITHAGSAWAVMGAFPSLRLFTSTYARRFSETACLTKLTVSRRIPGSSPTILLYGSARFFAAS